MTNKQKQMRFSIRAGLFIAVCLTGTVLFRVYDPITKWVKAQNETVYQPYYTGQETGMQVDSNASLRAQELAHQAFADHTEQESPYALKAEALLKEADGAKAEPVSRVYTTKRAVAFYFSGLGNASELAHVLEALEGTGSVGQFFITREELDSCRDEIQQIVAAGMQLGISFRGGEFSTARDQLAQWLEMEEQLRSSFGYKQKLCLWQSNGSSSDLCLTAAAAGGYTVVKQLRDAVPAAAAYAESSQEIVNLLYPKSRTNLQRGESVHFRMNQIQNGDKILGNLVAQMALNKSDYPVVPMLEILADTKELYTFPLNAEAILPEVKDVIYPGQLGKDIPFSYLDEHYIGAHDINNELFLPGFTANEVAQLDRTGLVPNDEGYIFLTFDDWGTDASIEPILQVLAKHNAKATFFIRTNYVESNPNLLRAIAKDGHAIGSHTDMHLPLSNSTETKKHESLTDSQIEELQKDLVKSYQKLQNIVGDLTNDNGPVLTRIFRPPTLAMSRNGLEAVLDCGFTYSVSGSGETEDFREPSAEQMVKDLLADTQSGAVIIMHMFENSPYTPEALDTYLTTLEENGSKLKFVPLSAALN